MDEETRAKILRHHSSGMSVRKIATQVFLSKSSVANIIKESKQSEKKTPRNRRDATAGITWKTKVDLDLDGLSDADKKEINRLRAKKTKKELKLQIAQIEAETANTKKPELFSLLIQVARTLTASESWCNDEQYHEEAVKVWKMLFHIFKQNGNQAMIDETVKELLNELDMTQRQFLAEEWYEDFGLARLDITEG